jgi:hypothetical protein
VLVSSLSPFATANPVVARWPCRHEEILRRIGWAYPS